MIDFSHELTESARLLSEYLRESSSHQPPGPEMESRKRNGWRVDDSEARCPWARICRFDITEVSPFGVLLTFSWLGESAGSDETIEDFEARRYVMLLGASNLLAQFQIDKWVTALDVALSGDQWHETAFRTGELWYVPISGS